MCPVQILQEPLYFKTPIFVALNCQKFRMSPSVTTNSKTVPLEFENNINHRLLLKTFYISSLHLDGISGITCLQNVSHGRGLSTIS